jgi:hypothetical protein
MLKYVFHELTHSVNGPLVLTSGVRFLQHSHVYWVTKAEKTLTSQTVLTVSTDFCTHVQRTHIYSIIRNNPEYGRPHVTCTYKHINAVAYNIMLRVYLWHKFCNTAFKIKHILHIAEGSAYPPPPPQTLKHSGCASATECFSAKIIRWKFLTPPSPDLSPCCFHMWGK